MIDGSQIILPLIPVPGGGAVEVRLNRNDPFYNLTDPPGYPITSHGASIALTAPTKVVASVGIGDYKRARNGEDLQIEVDSVDITFIDFYVWEGIRTLAGPGAPISGDGRTDRLTFWDDFFSDDTATYYLWLTHVKGASREIYFAGTVIATNIPRDHGAIDQVQTTTEYIGSQDVTITAAPFIGALKTKTVGDLVAAMTVDDMVTATEVPFYNGMVPNGPPPGTYDAELNFIGEDIWYIEGGAVTGLVNVCGYMRDMGFYTPGFPRGTWGMMAGKVLEKIAEVCVFAHDPGDDFQPEFEFTDQPFNATDIDVPVGTGDICVCYNYLFGVSPWDGSAFDSPITWKRDAPLSEVVKAWCWLFGCVLLPGIDQTYGIPRLRLRPRRESAGAFPASLELIADSSKEAQRRSAKGFVEVSNKASDGSMKFTRSPVDDGADIESVLRTRAVWSKEGANHVYRTRHVTFNSKWDSADQQLAYSRFGDSDNHLNPDGWILGAYLYRYYSDTGDGNKYYPPEFDDAAALPDSDWTGFYPLRSCTEKGGVYTNRDNTLYAHGQYYAQELLAPALVLERAYRGFADDTGSILGLRPGLGLSFRLRGADRSFIIDEAAINVLGNTTETVLVEVPLYADVPDITPEIVDSSGNTAGGAGSPTGSVSGGSNVFASSSQSVNGRGTLNRYAKFVATGIIADARAEENGARGIMQVVGLVADDTPAIYGGDTTTGYAESGVKGVSDAGVGVEAVSPNGSAVKATSTSGIAVESVGLTKTTTLRITGGSPAAGMPLEATDSAGNVAFAARRPAPIMVRCVITYDYSGVPEALSGVPAGTSRTDGVTVAAGTKVLVMFESDPTLNDVYFVRTTAWDRTGEVLAGSPIQVMNGGTAFGGASMFCTNTGTVTPGTTLVSFGRVEALPIDGSVTSATIVDGSVGTAELADGSVTSAKIADGTIMNADVSASAAIAYSKLNLANSIQDTDLTANSVTETKIADEAVTPAKIDGNSGTPGQVLTTDGVTAAWGSVKLLVDHIDVADADHTLTEGYTIIQYNSISAARDVSLPTAATPEFIGRIFVVKDISGSASGTNKITLTPTAPSTIDGATSIDAVITAYGKQWFYADGTNWYTL